VDGEDGQKCITLCEDCGKEKAAGEVAEGDCFRIEDTCIPYKDDVLPSSQFHGKPHQGTAPFRHAIGKIYAHGASANRITCTEPDGSHHHIARQQLVALEDNPAHGE